MPGLLWPRAALGQRGATRVLRAGVDALLAVALAPHCAACGSLLEAPLAGPVCAACWARVRPVPPPLCRTCGDALASWRVLSQSSERCPRCRRGSTAVALARAAGDYDGALRDIVHAFKYEGRRVLAAPLARLMRHAARDVLQDATCVIPVPLHPVRRVRRGFNQSRDLARHLGPPVVSALWRVRRTAPQTGLDRAARRRNVRGAFRLSPLLMAAARHRLLRNRVVVLVDDVRTTGATLDACAGVLVRAGVREVRALTAARATLPPRCEALDAHRSQAAGGA